MYVGIIYQFSSDNQNKECRFYPFVQCRAYRYELHCRASVYISTWWLFGLWRRSFI